MSDFFISDTHFGDSDIIIYENRPFSCVGEMDTVLISNWNSVVGKDDRVFFLGYFSMYGFERTVEIVHKLNGLIVFIKGNHDVNEYFDDVNGFPIIYNDFFMCSHKPMYVNSQMPYVNIHGHLHGNKYADNKHVNVSCEQINYTPIKFEEILKLLK